MTLRNARTMRMQNLSANWPTALSALAQSRTLLCTGSSPLSDFSTAIDSAEARACIQHISPSAPHNGAMCGFGNGDLLTDGKGAGVTGIHDFF